MLNYSKEKKIENKSILMKMYNFSLVLRIRCDAKMSQCPLGEKFGCNPETEAPQLIELAKSLDLNVCSVQC